MPDTFGITARERDGIAAAVIDVPGVEAETDERRVRASKQLVYLARRLDVCPGVGMERTDEPHLLRSPCDLVRAIGEAVPVVFGEARISRAHPPSDTLALGAARLREHEDGRTEIGEEPRGLHRVGELLVVPAGVVKRDRTERSSERESALAQLAFKAGGVLR